MNKKPFWNGSVLEPLIRMCMEDEADDKSTTMSWTLKWRDEEQLDR